MNKTALAVLAMLALPAGCAPPIETASTRLSEPSSISLINAPDGALLSIEGRTVPVNKGSATISVSDGWHDVVVLSAGQIILSRRIFIQDGSARIIDFSSPS